MTACSPNSGRTAAAGSLIPSRSGSAGSSPRPERRHRRTSYHSFRHGFRDALREAQASDEIVDALLGWTRRAMRETYGSGPRITALAEVVSRVRYDGLDGSDLPPR